MSKKLKSEFIVAPSPLNPRLVELVTAVDHTNSHKDIAVPVERPLTLFLNSQEVVTMMTIGDYPKCLGVGYLLNQNMLKPSEIIVGIDFDEEINVVVVRTNQDTDFEEKLRRKTLTSGCAQGTAFGDVMEKFSDVILPDNAIVYTSWIYALSKAINAQPSIYLRAGAIHGCVLCEGCHPLIYMEDVGRHNAIDKIAGYMHLNGISSQNKIFYTTGRLTSEMVIKCVQMGIPILISRSGFTAWGVSLAQSSKLTLIGRAKGKKFLCVSGRERVVFDADPKAIRDENTAIQRKASVQENDV